MLERIVTDPHLVEQGGASRTEEVRLEVLETECAGAVRGIAVLGLRPAG